MRRIAALISTVVVALGILTCSPSGGPVMSTDGRGDLTPCAGYRWSLKIGLDPAARSLDLTPQITTIAALDGIGLTNVQLGVRSAPAETTVYELQNVIVVRTYSEPDLDNHIIVRDKTGKRITLESTDPSCARGSAFASQIAAVRSALDTLKPSAGSVLSVVGVGFYDVPGSQGMELHPLLSVCVGRNCQPAVAFTRAKTSGGESGLRPDSGF